MARPGSAPPNRDVEHDDAERQRLECDGEAQPLEQRGQVSGLGKPLHGFGQVAIRMALPAAEPAGYGRHDPREIEAIGAHQEAGRWWRELEDDEPPARSQHPMDSTEGLLAINQVAQTEADGDRVDAGVGFVEKSMPMTRPPGRVNDSSS